MRREGGSGARPDGTLGILLIAENMSSRLSGETVVPHYYFRHFMEAGHDVRVLSHARVREHLRADLPARLFARIEFVEDRPLQRLIYGIGRLFPHRVEDLVFNQLIQLVTQSRMRGRARDLIAGHDLDVVFQPIPLAATAVSAMYRLGCPVVIGPMSGGMELPAAFRDMDGPLVRCAIRAARRGSVILQRLMPGKRAAAALIVANARTRAALPGGLRGRVYEIAESGVDLERWQPRARQPEDRDGVVSFIFCGRFVDWKGIGLLVSAFAPLAREGGVRLDLVGDGALLEATRAQVLGEGLSDHVILHGRLPLEAYIAMLERTDVFVTPSLRECGGLAMMEAMAIGLPVIGVNWGGAAQYAGASAAMLIDPSSPRALVDGLTAAMRELARSPEKRRLLGKAGRRHLEQEQLGWAAKSDRVLGILSEAVAGYHAPTRFAA